MCCRSLRLLEQEFRTSEDIMSEEVEIIINNALEEYELWLKETKEDTYMQKELSGLEASKEELLDCFGGELSFGTSGIRGIIGPGPRRINKYVVGRATQGLADYINKRFNEEETSIKKRVVIACDSRRFSTQLAKETAEVLSGNDIEAYLFTEISPSPLLSYSIEALDCDYGIMITASHNPSIFNGYKVFNKYGYQVVGEETKEIYNEITKLDYFNVIKKSSENISMVPDEIANQFSNKISEVTLPYTKDADTDIKIVYTPLNGAGRDYVYKALDEAGFKDVISVPSQDGYDENFTTCKTPNPEKLSAYNEAFKVLDQFDADIIIASDPDSDRVGVALIHDGMKVNLTGNQIALLMLDYLCSVNPPKDGQKAFRSVVSTPLIDRMADANGLGTIITLAGFKHIGAEIQNLINDGCKDEYYFGFEDSNGFLISPFLRDKDAISSAVIIAAMAAKHKKRGQDLIDHLDEIYSDYGTLIDRNRSFNFEGYYGMETMENIMLHFREKVTDQIGDLYIEDKIDYLTDDTGLDKSNIIKFDLDDGSTAIIRPSGTEPKIKVYMYLTDPTSSIDKEITNIIENFR